MELAERTSIPPTSPLQRASSWLGCCEVANTIATVKAELPEVPIYDSLIAMIKAGGIDPVTITTPPHTLRELVLEAIAANLHAVADKPFAPSAAVVCELDAAAKKKVLCWPSTTTGGSMPISAYA